MNNMHVNCASLSAICMPIIYSYIYIYNESTKVQNAWHWMSHAYMYSI